MLSLPALSRLALRNRCALVLVGGVIALGLVGLGAHAALPDHHDRHGGTTVCVAALAVASAIAAGWRAGRRSLDATTRIPRALCWTGVAPTSMAASSPRATARAGPLLPILRR